MSRRISVATAALAALMWAAPAAPQEAPAAAATPEPVVVPVVVPVDSVTLEGAVARALQANPQVVQATTGVGTAELGIRQAYAGMLPSLSLSSGASLSSSERWEQTTAQWVSGQSDSYSAGISTNVDLFSGGRNLAQVRSARATAEAAAATLVTRRFSAALAAKQAFFAVLRAEELIALNRERIEQAQEQLAAAERRLQVGTATRSDALRARLQVANAQQSLLQSTTQLRSAMYTLGSLVGIAGPVAAVRPTTLAPEPLALDDERLKQLVLEASPGVEAALANVGVAEASLAQARAQYLPTLGLTGGYNWSNQEMGLAEGRTSWSTRLSLSYPLFNGLQRAVTTDRANAQLTVAEAEAANAARNAVAEVESLLAALRLAELQLAILEESIEVAREDYRVQQERYSHGASTILDLLSSQVALTQAEYDLINARYDYQIAKAELESLVGREL